MVQIGKAIRRIVGNDMRLSVVRASRTRYQI